MLRLSKAQVSILVIFVAGKVLILWMMLGINIQDVLTVGPQSGTDCC